MRTFFTAREINFSFVELFHPVDFHSIIHLLLPRFVPSKHVHSHSIYNLFIKTIFMGHKTKLLIALSIPVRIASKTNRKRSQNARSPNGRELCNYRLFMHSAIGGISFCPRRSRHERFPSNRGSLIMSPGKARAELRRFSILNCRTVIYDANLSRSLRRESCKASRARPSEIINYATCRGASSKAVEFLCAASAFCAALDAGENVCQTVNKTNMTK